MNELAAPTRDDRNLGNAHDLSIQVICGENILWDKYICSGELKLVATIHSLASCGGVGRATTDRSKDGISLNVRAPHNERYGRV